MRSLVVLLACLGGILGSGCASRTIVKEDTCRKVEVYGTVIPGYLDCEKE